MSEKVPDTNNEFEQAKTWFNTMNVTNKNHMIITMYRLCIGLRDTSHEQLAVSLTTQFNTKLTEQNEYINQILTENETLMKSSNLNTKPITIEQVLGSIPDTSLEIIKKDIFLLCITGHKILITKRSKELEKLEKLKELENLEQLKNTNIDFIIRTKEHGKTICSETINFCNKQTFVLEISDTERLLYTIDAGILISKQFNGLKDANKFMLDFNYLLMSVELLEKSITERQQIVSSLVETNDTDKLQLESIRKVLNNFLKGSNIPVTDRVIGFYKLLVQNNKKVTKSMLEKMCIDNHIPVTTIRNLGGIKSIKEKSELGLIEKPE